jgi:hypothetical protein
MYACVCVHACKAVESSLCTFTLYTMSQFFNHPHLCVCVCVCACATGHYQGMQIFTVQIHFVSNVVVCLNDTCVSTKPCVSPSFKQLILCTAYNDSNQLHTYINTYPHTHSQKQNFVCFFTYVTTKLLMCVLPLCKTEGRDMLRWACTRHRHGSSRKVVFVGGDS